LFSSTKRIGLVEADAMVSNWLGIEASAAHTSNENRISKNLKPQLLS
jgi:GTP-binding protein